MSLFSCCEFWSTQCGENESFGFESLVITDLDGSGHDKIVVGSYGGFLRIYDLQIDEFKESSFKPSDLLLEMQLTNPILQVATGKLVSGTKSVQIGVLHAHSFAVYDFVTTPGSTEHGDQYALKMVYEHQLSCSSYRLIVGAFGAVQGRDFACILALDGTMVFFEQETFAFRTQLATFLLPTPMVYESASDSFVTLNADWCIERYRYQDLGTALGKPVVPVWTHNLGETVIDIQTSGCLASKLETITVVLSERNLTYLNIFGLVVHAKRLQYVPVCFRVFQNETKNSTMALVCNDGGMLFIYEYTTLRWCAKLPIVPVVILKSKIGIKGSIVLLSDDGKLKCCYLGTEPSLFVAPRLENSVINYKKIDRKLEKLQEEIRNINVKSLSIGSDQDISLSLKLSPFDKSAPYCQIVVELTPNKPLSNVRVTFEVTPPFQMVKSLYPLSTLYEKTIINGSIQMDSDFEEIGPVSTTVMTIIHYINHDSVPRLIHRTTEIHHRFFISTTSLNEELPFKVNLHANKPPLPLTTIFQEFKDEKWNETGNNDETSSFCLRYNSNKKCSVVLLNSKHGYGFSSNSLSLLSVLLKHVVSKCKNSRIASDRNHEPVKFSCQKNISINILLNLVSDRMNAKNEIRSRMTQLEQLSSQYRLIQRRMLIKLKDKVPTPLTAVQALYQVTYQKIIECSRQIEQKQKDLQILGCDLQVGFELYSDLILMNGSRSMENEVLLLKSAIAMPLVGTELQGWEERTEANLTYLLSSVLSTSNKDQHRTMPSSDKIVSNADHLKKLIITAFERLGKGSLTSSEKSEPRAVSPILETEENPDEQLNVEKRNSVPREKLLTKRQELSVHSKPIENLSEISF